jgi:hypothetical protein
MKEESQLSAITGQRGTEEAKSASGGSAGATACINWGTVLEQLPKQFKASQTRTVRGLKNSGPLKSSQRILAGWKHGSAQREVPSRQGLAACSVCDEGDSQN